MPDSGTRCPALAVNAGVASNRTDIFAARMASPATMLAKAAATRTGSATAAAGETAVQAPTADALPVTPELAERLTASIARTVARRVHATQP